MSNSVDIVRRSCVEGVSATSERNNAMRFMVMVMLDEKSARRYEEGYFGDPSLYQEMDKYNQELIEAGVMLSGDGLMPTSKGARIEYRGGKPSVFDGPFAETKELFGGYWIFKTETREEAIEWARKAPMEDGDTLVVRQIQEMEDFMEAINAAADQQ
jgi:hypothetical protein